MTSIFNQTKKKIGFIFLCICLLFSGLAFFITGCSIKKNDAVALAAAKIDSVYNSNLDVTNDNQSYSLKQNDLTSKKDISLSYCFNYINQYAEFDNNQLVIPINDHPEKPFGYFYPQQAGSKNDILPLYIAFKFVFKDNKIESYGTGFNFWSIFAQRLYLVAQEKKVFAGRDFNMFYHYLYNVDTSEQGLVFQENKQKTTVNITNKNDSNGYLSLVKLGKADSPYAYVKFSMGVKIGNPVKKIPNELTFNNLIFTKTP